MKYLSPQQKDGLIENIAALAESRLDAQSKKVLSEFDLNNEGSALKRLITQIETNFDANNSKSALGVIKSALEETRKQISKDLTLNDENSSLSLLQKGVKRQLDEIAGSLAEFQERLSERLGIKEVQARTPEGGYSFEQVAAEALKQRIEAFGDGFASVGDNPGRGGSKKGDHLQTLGEASFAPGARIVYECKRDKTFKMSKVLEEMKAAMEAREAEMGVFLMSAETLRKEPKLRAEYPSALRREGTNFIVAVWDAEDPSTDVVLDCVVSMARGLLVKTRKAAGEVERKEIGEIDDAIADMERQFKRFDQMSKWCDKIMETSKDVSARALDIQEELRKVLKKLKTDVESLNEGLGVLRSDDHP
jgi:hypothetical protein